MTHSAARGLLFALVLGLLATAVNAAGAPDACDAAVPAGQQSRPAAIRELACQVQSHRLLLFGELHGTAESPALLGELLREQPATRPIRLGLEWPIELQSRVATYFRSAGTPADRVAFAAGRDWTWYDGRMSQAWLALVDTLRDLHRQGRDVQVFTMEPAYGAPADVAAAGGFLRVKEAGMANAIQEQLKHAPPGALVAALMGNYHPRVGADVPDRDSSVTWRLAADHPLVLLPRSTRGTFWAIVGSQNRAVVQTIDSAEPPLPPGEMVIKAQADVPAGVLAETILLPRFSASPHP